MCKNPIRIARNSPIAAGVSQCLSGLCFETLWKKREKSAPVYLKFPYDEILLLKDAPPRQLVVVLSSFKCEESSVLVIFNSSPVTPLKA